MNISEQVLAAVGQHTRPDGSVNSTTLSKAIGCPRSTVQHHLRKLSEKTPPGKFETPPGFKVKRISPLVDGDGNVALQWMRLEPVSERLEFTREAIEEMFSDYRGKAEFIDSPSSVDSDLLTLYPTADLHIGMLAWGRETGFAWDLSIARNTLLRSMSQLIQCSPASHTAVLLDLGDQMHANDQKNVTPHSGNQLDVDGRFPKVAKEAVKLRREMIELALQKHEKVIYRGLPGNHDPEAQQWLTIAMSLFFEDNPRVIVDDDPSDFWFYQHGSVMLAGNHGHKMKPDLLPAIMASYQPKMWGSTTHRFAFSGHIHHERSGSDRAGGARWETLRTIAPQDAFAHSSGFKDGRELTAITYSAERGQRLRQFMPV